MGLILELEKRNDALLDNGPQLGDRRLSENGSSWLWAVFSLYAVSLFAVLLLSLRPRGGERIFHHLFTIALLVGTLAYFAMASGLGYVVVQQANQVSRGLTRQIYWPKYVNWVVSFPVIAMALGLISGVSWTTIIYYVFLTWTWIISYLIAAFVRTNYKWGFFAFGTLALVLLVGNLLFNGHRGFARLGMGRSHTLTAAWVGFLWLILYPLAWGVSDGGNRIGVTGSLIWFGILDLLLVPVLAFAFILRRWDYGLLNMHFTQYGRVARGADYPEKGPATGPAAAGTGAPASTTAGGAPVATGAGGTAAPATAHQAV